MPAASRLSLRRYLGRDLGVIFVGLRTLGECRFGGLRGLGAGTLAEHPLLDVTLRPGGHRERAWRHVTAHDRPATGHGAVADAHRRDERVVGPGPGMPPDRRTVLVHPVVVGEDRARADVRALADLRVADVGQVRDLRAVADLGVLGLDERADLALRAEHGAGTQVGERPDRGAGADVRAGAVAAYDGGALPDRDVG